MPLSFFAVNPARKRRVAPVRSTFVAEADNACNLEQRRPPASARSMTVLRVTHLRVAVLRGSNGGPLMYSKTASRSQTGTTFRLGGRSLNIPSSNRRTVPSSLMVDPSSKPWQRSLIQRPYSKPRVHRRRTRGVIAPEKRSDSPGKHPRMSREPAGQIPSHRNYGPCGATITTRQLMRATRNEASLRICRQS